MKIVIISVVCLFIMMGVAFTQTPKSGEIGSKYGASLDRIFEIQKEIRDIHPILQRVYPVAIFEDNSFYVFEPNATEKKYSLAKFETAKMAVPQKVRASMPLGFYGTKPVCVVTGDVFESPDGYVTIFHEFVHCAQWEEGELEIKQNLGVAQKAMAKQDYMWEINYPFPYESNEFSSTYSQFLEALAADDRAKVLSCRKELKQILNQDDYEYMVWQEWKEGLARYLENQMKKRLGLDENRYGEEKPFHRISFYVGGSRYIGFLKNIEPGSLTGLKDLFFEMLNSPSSSE